MPRRLSDPSVITVVLFMETAHNVNSVTPFPTTDHIQINFWFFSQLPCQTSPKKFAWKNLYDEIWRFCSGRYSKKYAEIAFKKYYNFHIVNHHLTKTCSQIDFAQTVESVLPLSTFFHCHTKIQYNIIRHTFQNFPKKNYTFPAPRPNSPRYTQNCLQKNNCL